MAEVQPSQWALFREGSGSPLFEAFRESGSVAHVERENDDGSVEVTVYGPDGEPAFTLERVPRVALKPTGRPPWGVRTGTRRRVPESDDDGRENTG